MYKNGRRNFCLKKVDNLFEEEKIIVSTQGIYKQMEKYIMLSNLSESQIKHGCYLYFQVVVVVCDAYNNCLVYVICVSVR